MQRKILNTLRLVFAATSLLAPRVFALSLFENEKLGPLIDMPINVRSVGVNPFSNIPKSFQKYVHGTSTFNEAFQSYLANEIASPVLKINLKNSSSSFGLLSLGEESYDADFSVAGVPLCNYQVRAHKLLSGGVFVLGNVPELDHNTAIPTPEEWPDLHATYTNLNNPMELRAAKPCFAVSNGQLTPMWSLTLLSEGLLYTALANETEVRHFQKEFFDAQGSAYAFEQNKLEGSLQAVTLNDLVGANDPTLTSSVFKTYVESPYQRASEPSLQFNYNVTDPRFDEVQAFVHAQNHLSFFTNLGFEWYGPKPMLIKLHVKPGGQINNALFTPGESSTSLPSIQIHDGDGVDLRNLISDGDVVSHELGHFIVYKNLKVTEGQSLVLHEGLADSFVFFRTADACLGNSICPEGGRMCAVPNTCLRTADNTIKYKDETWNQWAGRTGRLGHLHGQVISGMLWTLVAQNKLSTNDVSRLTYKAVSYFKADSGFCDFIASLVTAEKELFNGSHADDLRAVINDRGLGEFLPDAVPTCVGSTGQSALESSSSTSSESTEKKTSKSNPFLPSCGRIDHSQGHTDNTALFALMLIPLLFSLVKMPKKVMQKVLITPRRSKK